MKFQANYTKFFNIFIVALMLGVLLFFMKSSLYNGEVLGYFIFLMFCFSGYALYCFMNSQASIIFDESKIRLLGTVILKENIEQIERRGEKYILKLKDRKKELKINTNIYEKSTGLKEELAKLSYYLLNPSEK